MLKIQLTKNITFFDVVYYLLSLTVVVMSFIFPKKDLYVIVPITVLVLICTYIHKCKKKTNIIFVLALVLILISNGLSLYNFDKYYFWITNLTTLQLILFSVVLKKYLKTGPLKSFLKVPVLISFALVLYIIYSVLSFLVDFITGSDMFFSLICAISIVVFMFAVSVIYINDVYEHCLTILTSGILLFFQMGLSTINEYLYYNKFFTVLIMITHFVALYFFMIFLVETNVINDEDIKEKFI